jgi:GNAT superfamily N-acetyltransferase
LAVWPVKQVIPEKNQRRLKETSRNGGSVSRQIARLLRVITISANNDSPVHMAVTGPDVEVRELNYEEFPLAEKLWEEYRGQKNDMPEERVFGVFGNATLAATARCTRHPDGLEMDCVFSSERFRGRGYARRAVQALIDACGSEQIFIHSTIVLISFYKTFGFVPIPEDQLPRTIRERFVFCFGEMEGCNVCPMVRGGR